MNIIGLAGHRDDGSSAGSGKDTVADILVECHGFTKVALADPIKRIAQQMYGFTDDQLWGSSEARNAPDKRYPRDCGPFDQSGRCHCCDADDLSGECFLNARFVLRYLGTQAGRMFYRDTWTKIAIDTARQLLGQQDYFLRYRYTPQRGIVECACCGAAPYGVVIPDVRWPVLNEGLSIKGAGGVLWRVDRQGRGSKVTSHASEEQPAPDNCFAQILNNHNGPLENLKELVAEALR